MFDNNLFGHHQMKDISGCSLCFSPIFIPFSGSEVIVDVIIYILYFPFFIKVAPTSY